jgi:hypothetical protein
MMPARIKQVGLSPEHQLVIHWWCMRCRKAMYVVKDLSECWEESPSQEELEASSPEVPAGHDRPQGDERFLHSMGIRFLADNET